MKCGNCSYTFKYCPCCGEELKTASQRVLAALKNTTQRVMSAKCSIPGCWEEAQYSTDCCEHHFCGDCQNTNLVNCTCCKRLTCRQCDSDKCCWCGVTYY